MKIITLSLVALALLATPAIAEPIAPTSVRIIDGDTIAVDGRRPNIRLVGFNAPETFRIRCEAGRRLGVQSTARLKAIVALGDLDLELVSCACKLGTEGMQLWPLLRRPEIQRRRCWRDSDCRGVGGPVCMREDEMPENAPALV